LDDGRATAHVFVRRIIVLGGIVPARTFPDALPDNSFPDTRRPETPAQLPRMQETEERLRQGLALQQVR
jgi:hypothetical protein